MGHCRLRITWSGRKIQAYTVGLTVLAEAHNDPDSKIFFYDQGLTDNTRYYYRLRADGPGGSSGNATATGTTPSGFAAPAQPTGFVVTAIENEGISLVWDSVSDPVTYNVQRATNTGFTQNLVTVATSHNGTGFLQTGLTVGTTYYYRVRAIYRGINGLWSSTRNATVLAADTEGVPDTPSIPRLIRAVGGRNQITVTWQPPASGDPPIVYFLDRATDVDFTLNLVNMLANSMVSGIR